VQHARSGDHDAFADLYTRYRKLVYAILLGLVPSQEVPDLLHDVFLVALRDIGSLTDPAAFPAWLSAIARNRAKMFLRGRRELAPLSGLEPAASRSLDASLDASRVLAHVRALPEKLRTPLLLRLVEGLSGPEIADTLGLSHGTVRVYLHQGMSQLRMRLQPKEGGHA
jgi:RNA polymerase sigma-70 factor (ECF subfamily)